MKKSKLVLTPVAYSEVKLDSKKPSDSDDYKTFDYDKIINELKGYDHERFNTANISVDDTDGLELEVLKRLLIEQGLPVYSVQYQDRTFQNDYTNICIVFKMSIAHFKNSIINHLNKMYQDDYYGSEGTRYNFPIPDYMYIQQTDLDNLVNDIQRGIECPEYIKTIGVNKLTRSIEFEISNPRELKSKDYKENFIEKFKTAIEKNEENHKLYSVVIFNNLDFNYSHEIMDVIASYIFLLDHFECKPDKGMIACYFND